MGTIHLPVLYAANWLGCTNIRLNQITFYEVKEGEEECNAVILVVLHPGTTARFLALYHQRWLETKLFKITNAREKKPES